MIEKEILRAFGAPENGEPLAGGQGQAWRYGNLVIKPIEVAAYYETVSQIFNHLEPVAYRISRPVKASNGHYAYKGYGATSYEPGFDFDEAIVEKLKVSDQLHADLKALGITQLPFSDDPWRQAHNILWSGGRLSGHDAMSLFCNKLLDQLPVYQDPRQLIHSDLGGNILFHESLPPLVIDFSPAIAPKRFADAVIVCDSIAWGNQPIDILKYLVPSEAYRVPILYAIAFRIITIACFGTYTMARLDLEWQAFKPIWDEIF